MTAILIVSDTHVTDAARLSTALLACAERSDHIIHAGDLSSLDVVHVLEQHAPTVAVRGNVESSESWDALPASAEFEIDGVRFAVTHDAGPAHTRHAWLRSTFPEADVCIYGHTHQPEISEVEAGRWIVNPGSAMQRRRAPFHSVVWLTVEAGQVSSIELVNLDAQSRA